MLSPFFQLRTRLLLLALLAALPALAYVGYTSYQERQEAELEAQEDALKIAQQVASLQERSIAGTRLLLSLLARTPQVRNYGAPACSDFLASLLAQNSIYANFGVIGPDGVITCSALPFEPQVTAADRLYFQRAQETRSLAIGRYQVGRITGRPSINLGIPLPTQGERPPAVLFAALDLAGLSKLFADARLPRGATVTLVDEDNTVLARHPDPSGRSGDKTAVAPLLRQRLGRAEVGTVLANQEGGNRLYAVTRLSQQAGGDLLLYVATPTAEIFATAAEELWRKLVLLGLVGLALLAMAWLWINVFVLRNVNSLLLATRRLASGDLSARSGIGQRKGELGELGRAFDDMAAALQRQTRDVVSHRERSERLTRVYAVISAINSTIIRIRDKDTLYTAACRIACEQGHFSLAWIAEATPTELKVREVWQAGGEPDNLEVVPRPGETVSDRRSALLAALREGRLIVYNDVGRFPRAEPWQNDAIELGYRSCIFIPLQLGGRTVSCLSLYTEELDFFDPEEVELLKELAADVSLGLDYLDKAERLQNLAYFDALTGLPNAALFQDRLRQALVATRAEHRVAVLLLSAVNLEDINRRHGLRVGDLVLKEVGERLAAATREGDTVARLRNEEFGVLLTDIGGSEDVASAARKLLAACGAPARLEGLELELPLGIGVALSPEDGRQAETLLENAATALRSLRETGETGVRFFTSDLQSRVARRQEIERCLRLALERDELRLVYQPIVGLDELAPLGLEALLRWRHPSLGEVPPELFLPIAVDTGLIHALGQWILEEAVAQARLWWQSGLRLPVWVNLAAIQLRQDDFLDHLDRVLAAAELPATALGFELNEGDLMQQIDRLRPRLEALAERGCALAIDDFGTARSSVPELQALPIEWVKLDLSLVQSDDGSAVAAAIALAQRLRRRTVAEGVETRRQREILLRLGCDAAQGHLFSEPQEADQVADAVAGLGAIGDGSAHPG